MYFVLHSTIWFTTFEISNKTKEQFFRTTVEKILTIYKMKKQLKRIKSESMLGGVAAGLAEYFDIDATIIRVILAIGIVAPFPVVIPYLIMWIVMPVKEEVAMIKDITIVSS